MKFFPLLIAVASMALTTPILAQNNVGVAVSTSSSSTTSSSTSSTSSTSSSTSTPEFFTTAAPKAATTTNDDSVVEAVWIVMIVAIVVCSLGIAFLIYRVRRTGDYAGTVVSDENKGMDMLHHF
eukprot:m.438149 g.438149  ORF g.438149 m.438149 type:complete len:124 (+) comp18201_c0_seq1:114-485(+)